jgi:hypothetical protein
MLNTFGLREEEVLLFKYFYDFLSQKYGAEIVDELEIPFSQMELFRYYKSTEHRQSLKVNGKFGCAYFSILEIEYWHNVYRRDAPSSTLEYQIWGIVELQENFGHTVLRHETLEDKLEELFRPIEVKFPEDRVFNREFYILSKDEMKAHKFFNEKLRTQITDVEIDDLRLEVLNGTVMISDGKNIRGTDLSVFAKFITDIADIHF